MGRIKERIAKNKAEKVKLKEKAETEREHLAAQQEAFESVRREDSRYEILMEESKKQNAELQLLNFPTAKVEGEYFYHTVQAEDKLQYVKEPIDGMKLNFNEEGLKRKIVQLQVKYGDVARERKNKKAHNMKNANNYENREEDEIIAKKSYEQLLKDPEKIIKKYLGFSRGKRREEKIIQLMCGLEAANTPEEAGLACIQGMHSDLFDLHCQKAKSPFLAQLEARNSELLNPHQEKNQSISAKDDISSNDDVPIEADILGNDGIPTNDEVSTETDIANDDNVFDVGEWSYPIPGEEEEEPIDFNAGEAFKKDQKFTKVAHVKPNTFHVKPTQKSAHKKQDYNER